MINALTVDVEDYYHVSAFEKAVPRADWPSREPRVERNTRLVLDLLGERGVRGTFFVLGCVAERHPGLVREIRRRGHEVASHGYGHERLTLIGPDRFREDLRRSKAILEDICGAPVRGYRAPSFSITPRSLWALDILVEEGFRFDSSIFPVHHDLYGMPGANPFPHEITRPGGALREFPLSTLRLRVLTRTVHVPISGGGYLRLFPLWLVKTAIRRRNVRDGHPMVLYFHPWELDPGQPRVRAGLKSRFRHYHNLHTTEGKVRDLLASFSFAPMGEVLGGLD